MDFNYANILTECANIANERQSQYGEATESILLACRILDETFGIKLTGKQFCDVIIALKLSRLKFKFKEDSTLDIVNYFAIGLACQRKEQNERPNTR